MTTHKTLDEHTVQVLWVIARNGHAREKVILTTLRKEGLGMRNRHHLRRCLQKLLHHGLVSYERDIEEYVLSCDAVYACREAERQRCKRLLDWWDKVKEDHEFQRAFGTTP